MPNEKINSFEYKSSLLGILPEGFDIESSWETNGLTVVKKPSDSSLNGPVDKEIHPTLIGSAILQRKYGITDMKIEPAKIKNVKSNFDSNSALAHFYSKCYESKIFPDFLCDRRIPLFFGVEEEISFAVMARRLKLNLKDGREKPVIEIKFVSDPYHFTDADPDGVGNGVGNSSSFSAFSKWLDEGETAIDNYAFVQGYLSRFSNIGTWKQETKKYSIGMTTRIDGVWKSERDSRNYKGAHLAELIEVPQSVIAPTKPCKALNSLYKRVWMRRNWMRANLTGEKSLLVGIKNEGNVGEMWLYDVDKIPKAVQLASENDNFETWTPNEVHEKLFKSLDLIYKTIESKKGTSAESLPFYFVHFTPKDSDALIYDQDEILTENFLNCHKQLILRDLPSKFPPFFYRAASFNSDPDGAKSDRELESQIPENFYTELDKLSVQTVLSIIDFPKELDFPSIRSFEQPDALNQYKSRHRDLELTFKDAPTVNLMLQLVKNLWKNLDKNLKDGKIPRGYENLVVERKEPRLAEEHPLSRKSLIKSKKAATPSTSKPHQQKGSQKDANKCSLKSKSSSNSNSASVSVSVTPAPQATARQRNKQQHQHPQQSSLFIPRQKDRRSTSFSGETIHEH